MEEVMEVLDMDKNWSMNPFFVLRCKERIYFKHNFRKNKNKRKTGNNLKYKICHGIKLIG